MSSIKSWLHAFRLRTLPLSFSAILTGTACSYWLSATFSAAVFFLSLLTTLFLQILSNLANDYGDSEKGTDNEERIGPKRAVQSGLLSLQQMKTGVIVCASLAFISGILLLYIAFAGVISVWFGLFVLLGLSAIAAAIKYTMGKNAYGYHGLGDVFVFVFFGLVGVMGTFFLQTKHIAWSAILLAVAIGAFSAAVLNVNNMRDEQSDRRAGKNTLVVKIGGEPAKIYSHLLVLVGWLAAVFFIWLHLQSAVQLLPLLCLPLFARIQFQIAKTKEPTAFDPYLKQLALSTFLFSLLLAVGVFGAAIL